jgi:predicted esterase
MKRRKLGECRDYCERLNIVLILLHLTSVLPFTAHAYTESLSQLPAGRRFGAGRSAGLCSLQAMAAYKVLFLHGKGENGETFQQRLAPLEAAIKAHKPEANCVFVSAPHELGPGKFAWWHLPPNQRSYTASEYFGIEETLAHVEAAWRSHGPFDAVLAHSQGAILTSVLLSKALQGDFLFRPQKSVLFGAAWPKPFEKELLGLSTFDYPASNFKPETLHVYAMNDGINPPEMAIQIKDLLGPMASHYEHTKGHDIPMDTAALSAICSFLFS